MTGLFIYGSDDDTSWEYWNIKWCKGIPLIEYKEETEERKSKKIWKIEHVTTESREENEI